MRSLLLQLKLEMIFQFFSGSVSIGNRLVTLGRHHGKRLRQEESPLFQELVLHGEFSIGDVGMDVH
jgi:hypothetical protein